MLSQGLRVSTVPPAPQRALSAVGRGKVRFSVTARLLIGRRLRGGLDWAASRATSIACVCLEHASYRAQGGAAWAALLSLGHSNVARRQRRPQQRRRGSELAASMDSLCPLCWQACAEAAAAQVAGRSAVWGKVTKCGGVLTRANWVGAGAGVQKRGR
ncbi:hypothetical protein T440DRAFT_306298 [Plenodomus tracheiphilus IPT5]|uniref:Uncharacterized protein n=1 Tax=Plenodomus tracheiphilus IPT5 TaxID=1408161 RepID=A0A6A7BDG4_9PLEO|nr:hypothetical protein T440DRAFT_306298 [Plenodomus tracheiphilus IPT5]